MPPKGSTSQSAPGTLSLPALLKLLTSSPRSPLTTSQAIAAASKLVPAGYTSTAKLATLTTQVDMAKVGIEDPEIRKGLMRLFAKEKKGPGKRKRGSDMDRPLPTKAVVEVVETDLDFDEILAEEALAHKSCVVNRAPVMTAWAMVVAERLGFRRQEALSIAHVYTELNASSKGVSIGILPADAIKPGAGNAQPFVDLMGRKIPVLSMQDGEWRAISKGAVAEPSTAFSYVRRSFNQQSGAVIGAMRVLADSFEPEELNSKGYGLYCAFRPNSNGWGKKAEMHLSTILDLRRFLTHVPKKVKEEDEEVKEEEEVKVEEEEGGSPAKKPKVEEGFDEFDAALDDELDLSALDGS